MATGISDTDANVGLNSMKTGWTHVALVGVTGKSAGNQLADAEQAGTTNGRQPISWGTATGGVLSMTADVTFSNIAHGTPVYGIALVNAASGSTTIRALLDVSFTKNGTGDVVLLQVADAQMNQPFTVQL